MPTAVLHSTVSSNSTRGINLPIPNVHYANVPFLVVCTSFFAIFFFAMGLRQLQEGKMENGA